MSDAAYEVEIKSLLGTKEAADALRAKLKEIDPSCVCKNSYTQLNHYFEGGDPVVLAEKLGSKVSEEDRAKMERIAHGSKISIRTREMNGQAKIVMKASVGDDSSANGVARLELEAPAPGMTLDQLDQEVLAAGVEGA